MAQLASSLVMMVLGLALMGMVSARGMEEWGEVGSRLGEVIVLITEEWTQVKDATGGRCNELMSLGQGRVVNIHLRPRKLPVVAHQINEVVTMSLQWVLELLDPERMMTQIATVVIHLV